MKFLVDHIIMAVQSSAQYTMQINCLVTVKEVIWSNEGVLYKVHGCTILVKGTFLPFIHMIDSHQEPFTFPC